MKDLPVVFNTKNRTNVLLIVIFAILCMVSQPVFADQNYTSAVSVQAVNWSNETVYFSGSGSITVNSALIANGVTINYSRPDSGAPFMLNLGQNVTASINSSTINLNNSSAGRPLIWLDKNSVLDFNGVTFNQNGSFFGVLLRTGPNDGSGGTINFSGVNNFNNIKPAIGIRNNGDFIVESGTTTFKESELVLRDGGTWTVEGGTLTFDETTVSLNDNTANPVFLVQNGATLEFKNSSKFNLAGLGGRTAVKVESGGKLIIDDSEIFGANGKNDTAFIIAEGGDIEIKGKGNPTTKSEINNNTNTSNLGNIIRMTGGRLTITNAAISNNITNVESVKFTDKTLGVISTNGTAITISGSTISNNTDRAAGAIFAYQPVSFTVNGSTFSNNTHHLAHNDTTHGGAAIHVRNGSLTLGEGNTFEKNKAVHGGAIRMLIVGDYSGEANLTIAGNNTFSENEARWSGGAIHKRGGELSIAGGSTFSKNRR